MTRTMWRRLVLERDGYTCRECPTRTRLHVHHIKQAAHFPELNRVVDNGITLCEDCHGRIKSLRHATRGEPVAQGRIAGENWRDVVGYEGRYSVSDFARVRVDASFHTAKVGRILKQKTDRDGYLRICLSNRGQQKEHKVHSLVAEAFIGPRPEGMVINHIDTVRANNLPGNLEYVTPAGNHAHALKLGRAATGDRNGSRLHPERLQRGDNHHARRHPEKLARGKRSGRYAHGERNGAHTHPERVARGDRHSSRTHPERMARGERNGANTHPESRARGDRNGKSKLSRADVLTIRASTEGRGVLAVRYDVSGTQIFRIRNRLSWKHI